MKKRLLSILLTAAILLTMLPGAAFATEGSNNATTVTVGGVMLSVDKPYWKNGDIIAATGTEEDWNAWFDADTGVLTLKDAVIAGTDDYYGIYVKDDLTLVLTDSSTVTGGTKGCGIYVDSAGTLTVTGNGSLTAIGGTTTNESCGIKVVNDICILGSATVIATGGTTDSSSYGVCAFNKGITVKESARLTATGGAGSYSYGMHINGSINLSGTAEVTAMGGKADSGSSYGMYTNGSINLSENAEVTAMGGTADSGSSYGMHTPGSTISISTAAEVTAIGGTGIESAGIYSQGGAFDFSNGKITVIGGAASTGNSCGLLTYSPIKLSGTAEVTAMGGKATGDSYGVYGNKVTLTDTAVLSAVGGSAGKTSYGVYSNSGIDVCGDSDLDEPKLVAVGGDGGSSYGIATHGTEKEPITYTNGLLVAKGGKATGESSVSKAMSVAPTVSEGTSAEITQPTGVVDGSGRYCVISSKTGENADYAVLAKNVTNATETVAGHLEWSDANADETSETLTLNNTVIIGEDSESESTAALTIPAGGTLTSKGFNVVLAGDSGNELGHNSYAIYSNGALSVTGSDAVTAVGGWGTLNSFGVYSASNCTISGITLNAIGGQACYGNSFGIDSENALSVRGSTLTFASGNSNKGSYGIYSKEALSVTGGMVTACSGSTGKESYGVWSENNVTLENTTLTALAGSASGDYADTSAGLCSVSEGDACATLTIKDSTVTARGGSIPVDANKSEKRSIGIYGDIMDFAESTIDSAAGFANFSMGIAATDNFTFKSGTVNTIGGQAVYYSAGLLSCGKLLTTGGTISAIGGSANETGGESIGLFGWSTIHLQGGDVRAISGTAGQLSYGIYTMDYLSEQSDEILLEGASVTAVGGTATGEKATSAGLYSSNITMTSGKVDAIGGTAVASLGMLAGTAIDISGGAGTASGSTDETTVKYALYPEPKFTNMVTFGKHTDEIMSWRSGTYNVTFNPQNDSETYQQPVFNNSTITKPADPVRTGYTFGGWYTTSECTTPWDFETLVVDDITLYAKWSVNTGSSSSGGGGSNTTTTTTKNDDGSTTTKVTNTTTGTVTETTKKPDGSTTIVETKKDGTVTTTDNKTDGTVTITEKKPDGTVTTTEEKPDGSSTKIEQKPDGTTTTTDKQSNGVTTTTKNDTDGKTNATVTVPTTVKDKVDVDIPTNLGDKDGKVTVEIVYGDGKKETVSGSYSGSNGKISLTVAGSASIEILDDFVPLSAASLLPFTDVNADRWSYDNIAYVYNNELFKGVSETLFGPTVSMNRGMLVTVLYRMAGNPDISNENLGYPYADVDAEAYYGDAVYWARLNGLVNGYSDEVFGVNDDITREQLAAILYRYAVYKAYTTDAAAGANEETNTNASITAGGNTVNTTGLTAFDDVSAISSYAAEAVSWAVNAGIINGSDNKLMPQGSATREQVAAMVQRFCEKIVK